MSACIERSRVIHGCRLPWCAKRHRPRSGRRSGRHRCQCRRHIRRMVWPTHPVRNSVPWPVSGPPWFSRRRVCRRTNRHGAPVPNRVRWTGPGQRVPGRPFRRSFWGAIFARVRDKSLIVLPGLPPVPAKRCRQRACPRQPHPGARHHRYRCSLPGLTGFTAGRRGGTGADP